MGENHYLPEIPVREAARVLDALRRRDWSIACAESCTGGLVSSFFTSVPGASDTFRGAVVAYNDEIKVGELDLPPALLLEHGDVSAGVAAAMARSVRDRLGADVGIGITGLTGAGGDGKPAGLTFLAVTLPDKTTLVRRYTDDFGPGRNDERAVRMAFQLILDMLSRNIDDDHNVPEQINQ